MPELHLLHSPVQCANGDYDCGCCNPRVTAFEINKYDLYPPIHHSKTPM